MNRLFFFISIFFLRVSSLLAQEGSVPDVGEYANTVKHAGEGMTLWQVLASGGSVMIALGVLSVFLFSLVLYMLFRLNPDKLVPPHQTERLMEHLHQQRYRQAMEECIGNDSIVSSIALAGLNEVNRGSSASSEAVEIAARKEVSSLWASLNYLSDIAQIAPMLGLLGTVLGMIQAFNTIAFDAAVVKPILLAGGVSKAMITTAGGLIVAIIAMIFYSMMRTRVQNITNRTETVASKIIEALRK